MSEYMEKFAVSRLTGAPPGYVGYEVPWRTPGILRTSCSCSRLYYVYAVLYGTSANSMQIQGGRLKCAPLPSCFHCRVVENQNVWFLTMRGVARSFQMFPWIEGRWESVWCSGLFSPRKVGSSLSLFDGGRTACCCSMRWRISDRNGEYWGNVDEHGQMADGFMLKEKKGNDSMIIWWLWWLEDVRFGVRLNLQTFQPLTNRCQQVPTQ